MKEQTARALADRMASPVTPEDAEAYLRTPVSEEEREGVLEQVRWFTRRYPTALERLAYVRRASARWRGMAPRRP